MFWLSEERGSKNSDVQENIGFTGGAPFFSVKEIRYGMSFLRIRPSSGAPVSHCFSGYETIQFSKIWRTGGTHTSETTSAPNLKKQRWHNCNAKWTLGPLPTEGKQWNMIFFSYLNRSTSVKVAQKTS
jgi:hypothetical protein